MISSRKKLLLAFVGALFACLVTFLVGGLLGLLVLVIDVTAGQTRSSSDGSPQPKLPDMKPIIPPAVAPIAPPPKVRFSESDMLAHPLTARASATSSTSMPK